MLYPVELQARLSSLTEWKIPLRGPFHHSARTKSANIALYCVLVGAEGFELSTSSSQSWRSTKLSYTPMNPNWAGLSISPSCTAELIAALSLNKKRVPKHPRITGAPGEIRTPDHQVRSLVLYPAELRARRSGIIKSLSNFVKRKIWRRERDSNPREGYKPSTPLAGEPLQPLGHLSGIEIASRFVRLKINVPDVGRVHRAGYLRDAKDSDSTRAGKARINKLPEQGHQNRQCPDVAKH